MKLVLWVTGEATPAACDAIAQAIRASGSLELMGVGPPPAACASSPPNPALGDKPSTTGCEDFFNAFAAARLLVRTTQADALLFHARDIAASPEMFDALASVWRARDGGAIVAPRFQNPSTGAFTNGYYWASHAMVWSPLCWYESGAGLQRSQAVECPLLGCLLIPATALAATGDLDPRLPRWQSLADWCQRASLNGFPCRAVLDRAALLSGGTPPLSCPETAPYSEALACLVHASHEPRHLARWRGLILALFHLRRQIVGSQRMQWSALRTGSPRATWWAVAQHMAYLHTRASDPDNRARLQAIAQFLRGAFGPVPRLK